MWLCVRSWSHLAIGSRSVVDATDKQFDHWRARLGGPLRREEHRRSKRRKLDVNREGARDRSDAGIAAKTIHQHLQSGRCTLIAPRGFYDQRRARSSQRFGERPGIEIHAKRAWLGLDAE